MNETDAEIFQRVQAGEFERFDELVHRHRPSLVRVAASKLGDAARAEDIVQEAFLAAFAARKTFDPQYSFRTWLWTILLNLCRRHHRRQRNRPGELTNHWRKETSPTGAYEPATTETGLSRLLVAERRQVLHDLLDELPEVQADALRLRFFGELKYDEIAQTMNCSLSAAKVRVRNGLATLSARLRNDEDHEVVP